MDSLNQKADNVATEAPADSGQGDSGSGSVDVLDSILTGEASAEVPVEQVEYQGTGQEEESTEKPDYESQYKEILSLKGKMGNELGELRKQVQDPAYLQWKQQQQAPPQTQDPMYQEWQRGQQQQQQKQKQEQFQQQVQQAMKDQVFKDLDPELKWNDDGAYEEQLLTNFVTSGVFDNMVNQKIQGFFGQINTQYQQNLAAENQLAEKFPAYKEHYNDIQPAREELMGYGVPYDKATEFAMNKYTSQQVNQAPAQAPVTVRGQGNHPSLNPLKVDNTNVLDQIFGNGRSKGSRF